MHLKRVRLVHFRSYLEAEFVFQPGMNLVVGVNGVGKSSLLDAIRFGLHKVWPKLTVYRGNQNVTVSKDDIKTGEDLLQIRMDFWHRDLPFSLAMESYLDEYRTIGITDEGEEIVRAQSDPEISPDLDVIYPGARESEAQPLCLYFPTQRARTVERRITKAGIGQAAAFNGALIETRDFNAWEIASWINLQEVLAEETVLARNRLDAVKQAAINFLPFVDDFDAVETEEGLRLYISKGEESFPVKQLSDGERGLISLVLDLAKRLAFANPGEGNPVRDGQAIVLIDELDLHLHPRWQRLVVKQLTSTFPNCQFICTTHSPQLIGEVPAERVTIIGEGTVYHPRQTYGMDSSRVLEEVMDAKPRNAEVQEVMNVLFGLIDNEKLHEAKEQLQALIDLVGESDAEVLRAQTMIMFLED